MKLGIYYHSLSKLCNITIKLSSAKFSLVILNKPRTTVMFEHNSTYLLNYTKQNFFMDFFHTN